MFFPLRRTCVPLGPGLCVPRAAGDWRVREAALYRRAGPRGLRGAADRPRPLPRACRQLRSKPRAACFVTSRSRLFHCVCALPPSSIWFTWWSLRRRASLAWHMGWVLFSYCWYLVFMFTVIFENYKLFVFVIHMVKQCKSTYTETMVIYSGEKYWIFCSILT